MFLSGKGSDLAGVVVDDTSAFSWHTWRWRATFRAVARGPWAVSAPLRRRMMRSHAALASLGLEGPASPQFLSLGKQFWVVYRDAQSRWVHGGAGMLCRAERARERAEFDAGHLRAYLMCTPRAAEVGAAQADGSARGVATSPPVSIVGTGERGFFSDATVYFLCN